MNQRSEPTLDELLTAFCSKDEAKASRAFELLAVLTRRGLNGYLREKLHSHEAREDVIEEVIRRIWTRRLQFQNRGSAAWWSLVKLAADQCRIDLVRKVGSEVAWDESELGDIPSQDLPAMEALLEAIEERNDLYRVADEVWLGFPPELSERDRARRVMAADLFFTQGFTWEQVCDVLNRGDRTAKVTRTTLDSWLSAPSTIRAFAFRNLYLENSRLAEHLLNLSGDEGELERISRLATSGDESQDPPENWSWPEVRAVIWRYLEGDRQDRIVARDLCTLNKEDLQSLFDRCLADFPFLENMKRMSADLAKWPRAREELQETGLWQRIVFEYYCKDTTHHRDIHDRTAPAAALAPYNLTLGMLNVWLSNGRLFAKLAAYVQSQGAGK